MPYEISSAQPACQALMQGPFCRCRSLRSTQRMLVRPSRTSAWTSRKNFQRALPQGMPLRLASSRRSASATQPSCMPRVI